MNVCKLTVDRRTDKKPSPNPNSSIVFRYQQRRIIYCPNRTRTASWKLSEQIESKEEIHEDSMLVKTRRYCLIQNKKNQT